MIERHFIEVFGITYMVEIETLEKVENSAIEKVSEQKVSKNCIKNSTLFKSRKEWFIKWL